LQVAQLALPTERRAGLAMKSQTVCFIIYGIQLSNRVRNFSLQSPAQAHSTTCVLSPSQHFRRSWPKAVPQSGRRQMPEEVKKSQRPQIQWTAAGRTVLSVPETKTKKSFVGSPETKNRKQPAAAMMCMVIPRARPF